MHQACWMKKAIYSINFWIFLSQFKLTYREVDRFGDVNVFHALVYSKDCGARGTWQHLLHKQPDMI